MELERGQNVDRYIVVSTLGGGGMGVVYAAYDPHLDRKIALKLMRTGEAGGRDSAGAQDLLREAQAMARLSHPNTVPIYDVGTFRGAVFIAMELVEGSSLKGWLREKPRSWREGIRAFLEVGRGLAAAHAVGLVHRDFKPDNVLLGRDGRFRVTDFGLAAASGELALGTPGTPAYMAPEQSEGRAVDGRTDQFSFCVALFEALYGQRPFPDSGAERTEKIHAGELAPPVRKTSVPIWVRRVIARGLRADPAERFPSMDALLAGLSSDPATRRQRYLAAGLAATIALSVGTWVLAADPGARPCDEPGRALDGTWDDQARAQVRQAFLATGQPFAGDTWERARKQLDAYAQVWTAARIEVCAAARGPGAPEGLPALRLACLDRHRAELSALVSLFSRADQGVLERALTAAGSLPRPSSCSNPNSFRFDAALLASPVEREHVLQWRAALAEGHSLLAAGRYAEGVQLAEKVSAEASAIRSWPTEAEAQLLLCKIHRRLAAWPAMEVTCEASARAAEVAGDDETKTRALAELVFVTAYGTGRLREAETWAQWAHAMLEKLGSPPELEAEVLDSHSALLAVTGRREEDLVMSLRALELRKQVFGPDHFETARSHDNLGLTYAGLGRYDLAVENARRAADIEERAFGPSHPSLILALSHLASSLAVQGDHAGAMRSIERARVLALQRDPEGRDAAMTQGVLVQVLADSGRYQEAIVEGEALETLLRRQDVSENSTELSALSLHVGLSKVLTGRAQEGLALCQQATALMKRFNRSIPVDAFWCVGEAQLALGRLAEARQALEIGMELSSPERAPASRLAHLKLALARTLVAGKGDKEDKVRARQLAEAARDAWRAVPAEKTALENVEAWLAKLGP